MTLTIGTRTSQLALWQTDHIQTLLQTRWPELVCEIRPYSTKGDETQKSGQPLPEIGGKGLFTEALENALHNGEIDIAVHSLKDLPVEQNDGIVLGAIIGRADARDALVAADSATRLGNLPVGAVVGTSSLRRQAQLLATRPDLTVRSIRGNVPTRIQKMLDGQYDAVVLAMAGLERLNLQQHIVQILPFDIMLPAPGQGALAVQCRQSDSDTRRLLDAIHQPEVESCVTAERTFLHALEGGCSTPVGAYAILYGQTLHLRGLVGSPSGAKLIEVSATELDPIRLAEQLADEALAKGARELLST